MSSVPLLVVTVSNPSKSDGGMVGASEMQAAAACCPVLIIGSTGYIGRFITSASLRLGHPTYLLTRRDSCDVYKSAILIGFKRAGATLVEGSLNDHEVLVDALKKVDVVICTIAEQHLEEQLKLLKAIKEAGNIKRFLPSEFGMDPAFVIDHAAAPGNSVFIRKNRVRQAIQEAGVPYTYVSANCFAGYFVSGLAQMGKFFPPRDKVVIYGSGDVKAVWVDEDDVGTYTLKAAQDPRTLNKTLYVRPPENILSLSQVVNIWEKKLGKNLEKEPLSEKGMLELAQDETKPVKLREAAAHFYQIFYRGDLVFDIGPAGCDTAVLYPDVEYTTVSSYLDRYA